MQKSIEKIDKNSGLNPRFISMNPPDVRDERVVESINQLIELCGGDPAQFSSELIAQMIQNSLKMIQEGQDIGQLKLMSRSLKEMRYAYRIFNQYKGSRCISIFGSA